MIESNIKEKVLRELRGKHTLNELNSKQRQELQMFCEKWNDILINLSSLSDSHAKEKIAQRDQKKYGNLNISTYLRSELFFWDSTNTGEEK